MTQTAEKLEFETTVGEDGVIRLPRAVLEGLGGQTGATLKGTLEGGELRLSARISPLQQAQKMVRDYFEEHNLPWPTDTSAERIRKMRDEDAAIEEARGRW